ncbi:MAG TPA: DUF4271 domain-containing protein [Anseongella sp.]
MRRTLNAFPNTILVVTPIVFLFAAMVCMPQTAWSQARSQAQTMESDQVIKGPSPADTSRNAMNEFLNEFYSNYPTDFDSFIIPDSRREDRVVPDLDFRIRPVREAWLLLVLSLLVVTAAFMARFFRKDLKDLLEGFFSNRLINQTIREPGLLNTPVTLLLLFLGSFSIGALLYIIIPSELLPPEFNSPQRYLLLSGMTLSVYLLRVFLLKMAGFVFGLREFVNSYLYVLYTATGMTSFLILIFLLTRLLGPPFLADLMVPALQATFLFFFVYQYTRGIWYLINTFQFPKFYLILYLCAFEICPLLILGMGLFNS